jgi:cation diffusion facilitator CzcD-associated flavoprotein CzcO
MPGIVIIGAGFGGIGMAIALRRAGFDDFVILEKSDDLGGTWYDNQYPGCACDVPSPLYSYSFELNPSWSRLFAPRQEIWEYLRTCACKYGVDEHIRYGRTVEQMDWDASARRWNITAGGAGQPELYVARAVVSAAGFSHLPSGPDIPGAARFGGPSFHSARWDHSCDLAGRRVAVIGTGASAIQIIPEVARQARRLQVFQRTPPWVLPRTDIAIPARLRRAFETVPLTARASRETIYLALEARAFGFAVHPKLMAPLEQMARRHIRKQIADPALRAMVTPDYTIGCKRILLSSDYYPALQRPGVELITEKITGITEDAVVTADGTAYETDVIVYATGFNVVESVTRLNVTGRDGRKLTPQTMEAYHGITVPGFPNFFMLLGPNTLLGHTSVVFMLESQIQHVMSCLRRLARDKADAIEVSEAALRHYHDGLQRRLGRAVWSEGGCTSWYLDADGVNRTLWPGFSFEYWARTRRARRSAYVVTPAGAADER